LKLQKIFNPLTSLFRGEKTLFKESSIIFSGKIITVLLALIITPILSRLYSPADYGDFAIFNSVIQNLILLGTLALPAALNVAKKDDLQSLLNLSLLVISLSTIGTTFIMFAVSSISFIPIKVLIEYWYLVPIAFLFGSVSLTLHSLLLRQKQFGSTTKIGVMESFSAKGVSLFSGIQNLASLGLIMGDILGKLVGSLLLLVKLPAYFRINLSISRSGIISAAKKVREYPFYVMPAQWASILSTQLIIWFIAIEYSAQELGKYTIALALITIPLHVLSNTFHPVITQRFVSARESPKNEFSLIKLVGLLGIISMLVFGGIFILPGDWFVYFLGEQWSGIGPIIKLLCIWSLFLFIDQSLNNGFLVFGKQRQKLYFNLVDLGLQVVLLTIASLLSFELYHFIVFFVLVKVMASIFRIGYIKKITSHL